MVLALPTLLSLLHSAQAQPASGTSPGLGNVLGYGPAAGALLLGREDLIQVRGSLGRISDELHVILGVIDNHLDAPPRPIAHHVESVLGAVGSPRRDAHHVMARGAEVTPLPRADDYVDDPPASKVAVAASTFAEFIWGLVDGVWRLGVFVLDVAIVVGMWIFLDSVAGRSRRGGTGVMSERQAKNERDLKGGESSIPTPSSTPNSKTRFEILSNDEVLASYLHAHLGKLSLGFIVAVLCRILQTVLHREGVAWTLVVSLAMMMRCMSIVMFFIKDEMTLTNKSEKERSKTARSSAN